MIVLTDGEDTVSQASSKKRSPPCPSDRCAVRRRTRRLGLQPRSRCSESPRRGRSVPSTPDPSQLSAIYNSIGSEISNTQVARFRSPVFLPGEAEFAVTYEGLTAARTFPVSGFATTTSTQPGAPSSTFAPGTTVVVESSAPMDMQTLVLIGVAGIGLTIFLFLVILFGRESDQEANRFAKRLQAYGRRNRPAEEEKKGFLHRLPLLNRFSQAAEEEVRRR